MAARAPFALTPYLFLARILLCLVFVPAGAQDLRMVEFQGDDAERIERLLTPPTTEPQVTDGAATPTALVTHEPTATQGATVQARSLYRMALTVEDAGWSSPVLFAWIAVLIKLAGGLLLLVGLLSRLWGLGLCVLMGAFFSITSLPLILSSTWALFDLSGVDFYRYAAQMGLFGMAASILVCGPGCLSLDRLLFGSRRRHSDASYLDDEDEEVIE